MDKIFEDLFYSKDEFSFCLKNGIRYYDSQQHGDQFNEDDISAWTNGGIFERRWANKGMTNNYVNDVYLSLCKEATKTNLPIIDIACGPGLGLLPDILSINPAAKVLATDACPKVIEKWSQFLHQHKDGKTVDFASFSVNNMPFRSNSVSVMTSNLGFSSLRYAGQDNMDGVYEAFRVLKPDGYIFTIENEFADMALIQKTFDLWGKENWFKDNKLSWNQCFCKAGFIIEAETPHLTRIESIDWELGEVASTFGIDLVVKSTAYKLRKICVE